MLSQDSFYRNLTEEDLKDVKRYNFDVPEAFDKEAILKCMRELKVCAGALCSALPWCGSSTEGERGCLFSPQLWQM